jgi:hypothetical protein
VQQKGATLLHLNVFQLKCSLQRAFHVAVAPRLPKRYLQTNKDVPVSRKVNTTEICINHIAWQRILPQFLSL